METKNKSISPTKPMDRLLARLRFAKAKSFIPKGARLLDVGAGEGTFDGDSQSNIGIEPLLAEPVELGEEFHLVPGHSHRILWHVGRKILTGVLLIAGGFSPK